MGIALTSKEVPPLGVLGDKPWPTVADTATAQGIGGAGPPQVAIGRGAGPQAMRCGGTPAKPGFLRSKKCAQMRFYQNLIYLFILYWEKHYIFDGVTFSLVNYGVTLSLVNNNLQNSA
jgi:hypothetical protein